MAKAATKQVKRTQKEYLPEMEPVQIEAIVQAADSYIEARDERMRWGKLVGERKSALIQVMENNKLTAYDYRGLKVRVSKETSTNVSVKAKDNDAAEAEADTRNTAVLVDELKAAADANKAPAPAPTQAESESIVLSFFRNTMSAEEAERFDKAMCHCGHIRGLHDDGEIGGACSTCDCTAFKCAECQTVGGHQASCKHYVLGEGTPAQPLTVEEFIEAQTEPEDKVAADEWTAKQCDECKGIDGAHSPSCSKASGLTYDNYLAYARAMKVKNAASWAKKWQMTHEKDGLVKAWLAEDAEKRQERVAQAEKARERVTKSSKRLTSKHRNRIPKATPKGGAR